MNKKSNIVLGAIFIIFGLLLLLGNFGINLIHYGFSGFGRLIGRFWPSIFLLLPGLAFHYSFFKGRRTDPGLLVPGGILLILGLAFQFNMLFGGWGVTWPLYIFSVAFGLFELYWFGNRDKGLLIPVCILGGFSLISLSTFTLGSLFTIGSGNIVVPAALIILGLIVLSKGRRGRY